MFIRCPPCWQLIPNEAMATHGSTATCPTCGTVIPLVGDMLPEGGAPGRYPEHALEEMRAPDPPPTSVDVEERDDRARVRMGTFFARTTVTVSREGVALHDLGQDRWLEPLSAVRGLVPVQRLEWAYALSDEGPTRHLLTSTWRLMLFGTDGHKKLVLVDLTFDEACQAAVVVNAAVMRLREPRGYRD